MTDNDNMAAQIPSGDLIKTTATGIGKMSSFSETPMMSGGSKTIKTTSGLFIMHGWNYTHGWRAVIISPDNQAFLQIFKMFTGIPADAFPHSKKSSKATEELSYYGSVQVCVLQNVFVSLPPPLVVLRQRVSSSAYLSVLYSRPPLRQRTRVYYSLQ